MAEGGSDANEITWPVARQVVEGDREGIVPTLQACAVRALLAVSSRLPESLLSPLLTAFAHIAKAVDRRHADSARVFLMQALGEMPATELEQRVVQAYRHLFRVSIQSDGVARYVTDETWREHCELDLCDEVLAKRGSPIVFVTPHVGNWEIGAGLIARAGFQPFYAVAKPPKNGPLSRYLQRTREAQGFRVLPRRGAMKLASEIVAGRGSLGLLLDQRARNRAVIAPFFGRPAPCDRSGGVLLKRLRVPVAIGACYLTETPNRYRLTVRCVLEPEEFRRASPEEISTRINGELEKLIRHAPDQYFWLHDRYRGAPQADPSPKDEASGHTAGETTEPRSYGKKP